MKHLLFTMVVASAMIISFNSCNKGDSLPVQDSGAVSGSGSGLSTPSNTVNVTTSSWDSKTNGVFVSTFQNIIPLVNAHQTVNVYVVSNGADILIDQPVPFMDGRLWATTAQKNVIITYTANSQIPPYLNIKIVIQ